MIVSGSSLWLEVASFHPFLSGFVYLTPAALTIHLSFCTQVSFVSWRVYPVLPWLLACSILKFWFSQDPCPGMGWLSHMVLCCWVSESPSVLFSRVDALIYIPIWGRRVPSLQTPSSIYCCRIFEMAMLTGVKWHLIELLICISLMIRDTEHLFAYFMSTWVPSMEKRPFPSLAHFSIVLFFLIGLPGLFACFGDEFLVSPFANTFFPHPFWRLSFSFIYSLRCCSNAFKINEFPFVDFIVLF